MTIGVYILAQNPISSEYPFLEVINNSLEFSDEILIVDGGTNDNSFDSLPKDNRIKIKFLLFHFLIISVAKQKDNLFTCYFL